MQGTCHGEKVRFYWGISKWPCANDAQRGSSRANLAQQELPENFNAPEPAGLRRVKKIYVPLTLLARREWLDETLVTLVIGDPDDVSGGINGHVAGSFFVRHISQRSQLAGFD